MHANSVETFIRLGAEFHRRGWVLGTSGNFSAVISIAPLRLLITASSLDKGRLSAEDFLEVDTSGVGINGAAGRPSAETLLHIAVVQATGAAAVLHTHSVWSTVLSDFHAAEGGFYIQVKPGDPGDKGSDNSGLFVYQADSLVSPGDRVTIENAVVDEYKAQIELTNATVNIDDQTGEVPDTYE